MIFLNGIFRNAPKPLCYALYLIWIELILFFLTTTMSQYIYRYFIFCRHGVMSLPLFWSLISANIFLNALHGVSLIWADYPRMEDGEKMANLTALVTQESGITNYRIIAFVDAVNLFLFWNPQFWIFFILFFPFVFVDCYGKRLGKTPWILKAESQFFRQHIYAFIDLESFPSLVRKFGQI